MAGEWEIKIKRGSKIVIQHDDNDDMIIEITGDKPCITGIGKRLLVRLDNIIIVEVWNPKRFTDASREKETLTREYAESHVSEYGVIEDMTATKKGFDITVDCKNLALANELRKKKTFDSVRHGSLDLRRIKILEVLDADSK